MRIKSGETVLMTCDVNVTSTSHLPILASQSQVRHVECKWHKAKALGLTGILHKCWTKAMYTAQGLLNKGYRLPPISCRVLDRQHDHWESIYFWWSPDYQLCGFYAGVRA